MSEKEHTENSGGIAVKLQLHGRSHSTTKVVVLEKRERVVGDYVSLSKEYRSKLLQKDNIPK